MSPLEAPRAVLAGVRLLVLDFDGVMTDNRVLVDQDGREAVWCHRGDGWGIARLREAGLPVVVLSTEENPVVAARCRKLGIPCVQGVAEKGAALARLAGDHGVGPEAVAYVGNDVNDLACLRWAGVPIVVADAVPEARALARLATTRAGGYGAVREVADWLLDARGRDGATDGGVEEPRATHPPCGGAHDETGAHARVASSRTAGGSIAWQR